MFDRFDEEARRALFFARGQAGELGADAIEPEHLLCGLLREGAGLLPRMFAEMELSMAQVRDALLAKLPRGTPRPEGEEMPFTAAAVRAIRFTVEEADRLHHEEVAPEHLLLGLLREPDTLAGSTLLVHGFRLSATREHVIAIRGE